MPRSPAQLTVAAGLGLAGGPGGAGGLAGEGARSHAAGRGLVHEERHCAGVVVVGGVVGDTVEEQKVDGAGKVNGPWPGGG